MPSINDRVGIDPSQIKTIAIIGGGASGAISLDSLIQENRFDITLFERRDRPGGVWCLDETTIETPNEILKAGATHVDTDPQLDNPFHSGATSERLVLPRPKQERFEETPSYANIKTNIIETMMTYLDVNRWPHPSEDPEERKYVDGLVVRQYIDEYISKHLQRENVNVVYTTTVEDVERIDAPGKPIPYRFRLTLRQPLDEANDVWFQQEFDSVVVAVGHYHVPFIPNVPGLNEVQRKFPGRVQHSKFYRNNSQYHDKSVIVIGSRSSGADLTKFLADVATTVYQSVRNTKNPKLSTKPNIISKPIIERYDVHDDNFTVVFEDGSTIENPDFLIYSTGYQFSFPFLNRLFESDHQTLTVDGVVIPTLYQHTFFVHEPLLNVVGVPVDGVSFRVFEYQAILVARFLSGRIQLPSQKEQREWIEARRAAKGVHRAYHTIGVDDAFVYLNLLVDLGKAGPGGREFPTLTLEDLVVYRQAGETLRKFWDER